MSDYKMVPVVATAEMRAAGNRAIWGKKGSATDSLDAYQAMLAEAPPFLVTDEVFEKAAMAICESRGVHPGDWRGWENALADARAAIEAVLGGGV